MLLKRLYKIKLNRYFHFPFERLLTFQVVWVVVPVKSRNHPIWGFFVGERGEMWGKMRNFDR